MKRTVLFVSDPARFAVKIEKNVPLPDNDRRPGPETIYPLREMEINDSFVLPIHLRDSVSSIATRLKSKSGLAFTIRKIDADTVRVWRTK